MRTTLELDDSVLAAAHSLASSRGISLGEAVSELALRGLMSQEPSALADPFYSPFTLMRGEPGHLVTDELVAAH